VLELVQKGGVVGGEKEDAMEFVLGSKEFVLGSKEFVLGFVLG
jgi:hypothetical protein